MAQTPSIGRVVHYMGPGTAGEPGTPGYFKPRPYPADILDVNEDGTLALFVKTKVGHMNLDNIPYSEAYKPNHWSWPPRVPEASQTEIFRDILAVSQVQP